MTMTVVGRRVLALQQAFAAEAEAGAVADDDVVVEGDAEVVGGVLDGAGHGAVGGGGGRVAAGVVVDEDEGGGVQLEGALDDFAGVDGGVVDGAAGLGLVGDEAVAGVEEQDAELFDGFAGEGGGEVGGEAGPVGEEGLVLQLGAGEAEGGGLNGFQGGGAGVAEALDAAQVGDGGADGVAKLPKRGEQARAMGLVSRRGRARKRTISSSSWSAMASGRRVRRRARRRLRWPSAVMGGGGAGRSRRGGRARPSRERFLRRGYPPPAPPSEGGGQCHRVRASRQGSIGWRAFRRGP